MTLGPLRAEEVVAPAAASGLRRAWAAALGVNHAFVFLRTLFEPATGVTLRLNASDAANVEGNPSGLNSTTAVMAAMARLRAGGGGGGRALRAPAGGARPRRRRLLGFDFSGAADVPLPPIDPARDDVVLSFLLLAPSLASAELLAGAVRAMPPAAVDALLPDVGMALSPPRALVGALSPSSVAVVLIRYTEESFGALLAAFLLKNLPAVLGGAALILCFMACLCSWETLKKRSRTRAAERERLRKLRAQRRAAAELRARITRARVRRRLRLAARLFSLSNGRASAEEIYAAVRAALGVRGWGEDGEESRAWKRDAGLEPPSPPPDPTRTRSDSTAAAHSAKDAALADLAAAPEEALHLPHLSEISASAHQHPLRLRAAWAEEELEAPAAPTEAEGLNESTGAPPLPQRRGEGEGAAALLPQCEAEVVAAPAAQRNDDDDFVPLPPALPVMHAVNPFLLAVRHLQMGTPESAAEEEMLQLRTPEEEVQSELETPLGPLLLELGSADAPSAVAAAADGFMGLFNTAAAAEVAPLSTVAEEDPPLHEEAEDVGGVEVGAPVESGIIDERAGGGVQPDARPERPPSEEHPPASPDAEDNALPAPLEEQTAEQTADLAALLRSMAAPRASPLPARAAPATVPAAAKPVLTVTLASRKAPTAVVPPRGAHPHASLDSKAMATALRARATAAAATAGAAAARGGARAAAAGAGGGVRSTPRQGAAVARGGEAAAPARGAPGARVSGGGIASGPLVRGSSNFKRF